jgi:hypothetical protein
MSERKVVVFTPNVWFEHIHGLYKPTVDLLMANESDPNPA